MNKCEIQTHICFTIFFVFLHPALGWGDPHYVTFDRHSTLGNTWSANYHFQGRGIYSTLEVLNEDGDIVFSLQGRHGNGACPPRGVTWHTGIAFGKPRELTYQVN